jgi:NAD(P)-dependent dehydrogenase (short-subunit alcohol dehydrogenase family)
VRFEGRVAVVTGAGGQEPSLGRTYARFLAERGARVVVNDIGVGPDGRGGLAANADQVVEEIVALGGEAVADTHSVATSSTAKQVVDTALDAWGRVDILINNAGVVVFALFDEISDDDCELILHSHLMGTLWMTRAAWPAMRRRGYGRVVNTCSSAMFGSPYNAVYGAAKAGIFGLSRGLALEGRRYGIAINAITPQAATRKHAYLFDKSARFIEDGHIRTVDQVAPAVAYLCHETCGLNGALLYVGGGRVQEYVFARTSGIADERLDTDSVARVRERREVIEIEQLGESSYEYFRPKPYTSG